MAINTTTTHATAILPRVLADRVLDPSRPSMPLLASMANLYSIAGKKSGVLRLNRLGDSGPATAATEGSSFTTETSTSYGTAVDLTPVEAAARLMKVSQRALQQRTGLEDALSLYQSNNVAQIVAALDLEARDIVKALDEKMDADLAALFASLSSSVGALTTDFSLSVLEQAIFNLDIAELPADALARRAYVLSPRAMSDIRRELQVTSGGVQGVMWGSQQMLVAPSSNSLDPVANLFGIPVYQMSQSIVPTSGTVPGTGGQVCALIVRGIGDPEVDGGSGAVGTLQVCEAGPPKFATDFVVRDRSIDVLGIHEYAVALRGTDFGVQILGDDA